MRKRVWVTCTYISTALLFGSILLGIYARSTDPYSKLPYFSLGSSFHVGITRGWGGQMVFFSDAPYMGSIIRIGPKEGAEMTGPTVSGWDSEYFGIYYRLLDYGKGVTNWTFIISTWYPVLFFASLPLAMSIMILKKRYQIRNS